MLNLSRYRIIAIGKVRKKWIKTGIDTYIKRLPGLTITELRDGTVQKESEYVLASLEKNEAMIVLNEEAEQLSSVAFSERLQGLKSQRLAFVIGGANGVALELKALAQWQLSLSPMTFPHEIAQLLLIEQIYRAHNILQGGAYHRH